VSGVIPLQLVQEAGRLVRICNACRYCEGFCAAFPAMERRHTVGVYDLTYLANLCHDCRECLYSCQYAPPHEFALDLPKLLAEGRRASYRAYAWPGALSAAFGRPWAWLAAASLLMAFALAALALPGAGAAGLLAAHAEAGGFYAVVPHGLMIGVFGGLGLFVAVALGLGVAAFWRDTGGGPVLPHLATAVRDALTLKYLDGGGHGCAYPEDVPSHAREWFHHLTFYGFLLCFAATTVAAFYDNILGDVAPYPFWSLPVVLGSLGGVGLLVGPMGFLWLKSQVLPEAKDPAQMGLDASFLAALWLTAATGFLLLAVRASGAMGIALIVHLASVGGLFLTMPYGKFVHGIYRVAALVRYAEEQSRRSPH
jgi:citrate/tricarballylate utilization protein